MPDRKPSQYLAAATLTGGATLSFLEVAGTRLSKITLADFITVLDATFATDAGQTSGLALKLNKAGDTMTGALVIGTGAVVASTPVLDLTQTFNNAGVTFTGIKFNVTDTASAAASKILDFQVGGTTVFKIEKGGAVAADGLNGQAVSIFDSLANAVSATLTRRRGSFTGNGISLQSGASISFTNFTGFGDGDAGNGSNGDIRLFRDAAAVLAQRVTTTAQTYRLYRTFTDASNYERLSLRTAAGQMIVAAETAGTGTDDLDLVLIPAGTGNVSLPGGTLLKTTAALTDGAAAALGTLTNSPTAGNPTKWVPVNDNGTTRYVPMW